MAGNTYGNQSQYDRSEMFAMGAAAGALIATAVQEVIERRKKKTPLEKASARAAALVSDGTEYARDLQESASAYVADLSKQSRRQLKQARKRASKQAKHTGKQAETLKDAAVGALGAVAASAIADQAREYIDVVQAQSRKRGRKAGRWFNTAGKAAA